MLTQRLFLRFSELQLGEDGVGVMPRRRDAVDVAVRESTRRARESRDDRDTQVGASRGKLEKI